uniref:Uncharacterized protein n=1 Tax=uncultured bacterium FLS18 TaxID=654935 RepID=C6G3Z7_9BACT|nr:hypothetical protein ObacDRAFT_8529 [uncultured bacterium FLS18]
MYPNLLVRTFGVFLALSSSLCAEKLTLTVKQLTHGPHHHFFGYIGQSLTTPWNASGRYILSLRTTFHDRMPNAGEAAGIVLVDTQIDYRVRPIEKSLAWNFQQGTMFYWNPKQPDTQFFFNDRDPDTNLVFTVLYDIERKQRVREYRFEDASVASGGVSPTGEFFLAINYGRLARLRPVTGYPGAADPTAPTPAPHNDGIFRVDVESGQRKLIVSFRQLRHLLHEQHEKIDEVDFYINHSLINRTGKYVYFFARARYGSDSMAVNAPCSVRTDGTELTAHQYIGGHPEWDHRSVVIGARDGRQIRYDIRQQAIVGQIATPEIIPMPGGDISLSPDANWLACGYATRDRSHNKYVILRRSDGGYAHSRTFSRGPYTRGQLRIDPAPRWNRDQTAILVPEMTADGTRQLHLIEIEE